MKLPFVIALLLVTSSVAAQQVTTSQQPLGTGGQTITSPLSTPSGAICQQEMTATFCNVPTSPNNGGYGSGGGAAATSAGITTPSPAIPSCQDFPAANELCN